MNDDTKLCFGEVDLVTGVRLRYAEQGDPQAHPLILLHGYTDSWFSFSGLLPKLSADYHLYALDQRGHGDSERPASGYAIFDFASDVVAFMDAMNLPHATLVGHSMGSFIAQQVAFTRPERVTDLVLIGSAANASTAPVRELDQAVALLRDPVPADFAWEFQASTVYRPLPDLFMARVVAESLKLPARVWHAALDGMLAANTAAHLTQISVPTLILWGDQDTVFPRAEQEALLAALPSATLKVYPQVGHALHWEAPDQCVRDIKAFISASPAVALR